MIRHYAAMLRAYAAAITPRLPPLRRHYYAMLLFDLLLRCAEAPRYARGAARCLPPRYALPFFFFVSAF